MKKIVGHKVRARKGEHRNNSIIYQTNGMWYGFKLKECP